METHHVRARNVIVSRCRMCYRVEETPCTEREWERIQNGEPFQKVLFRAVAEDYYFLKYGVCKECYRRGIDENIKSFTLIQN